MHLWSIQQCPLFLYRRPVTLHMVITSNYYYQSAYVFPLYEIRIVLTNVRPALSTCRSRLKFTRITSQNEYLDHNILGLLDTRDNGKDAGVMVNYKLLKYMSRERTLLASACHNEMEHT